MIDSIKQLLQQEAQAVLNIPVTDAYEKAVKLIVEQIMLMQSRYAMDDDRNTQRMRRQQIFLVLF